MSSTEGRPRIELGSELRALYDAAASPGPDFAAAYARAAAEAERKRRSHNAFARSLPFAAAACLALGLGFGLLLPGMRPSRGAERTSPSDTAAVAAEIAARALEPGSFEIELLGIESGGLERILSEYITDLWAGTEI
jgi:hypothetical protein